MNDKHSEALQTNFLLLPFAPQETNSIVPFAKMEFFVQEVSILHNVNQLWNIRGGLRDRKWFTFVLHRSSKDGGPSISKHRYKMEYDEGIE